MNTQQATIASLLGHRGESFDQFFPGFLTPHYFPLYSTFVLFKFSSGSRVSYHVTFVTCFLLPHGSGRSCCCFIRDSLLKFIPRIKEHFRSEYPSILFFLSHDIHQQGSVSTFFLLSFIQTVIS